jgi:hypothetical protein
MGSIIHAFNLGRLGRRSDSDETEVGARSSNGDSSCAEGTPQRVLLAVVLGVKEPGRASAVREIGTHEAAT